MILSYSEETFLKYQDRIWEGGPRGTKKPLSALYSFGQFRGKSCFVVGGGPSLTGFDFCKLENKFTIALNRMCALFAPNILYAADHRLIIPFFRTKGDPEKTTLVIGDMENAQLNDCYYVRYAGFHGIPERIDRIFTGDYSCYGAVNLAIALGFNPIYLLGFDFSYEGENHHAFQPWPIPDGYKEIYLTNALIEMEDLASLAFAAGVDIINLNPKSALKAFRFGDLGAI